MNRFLLAIVVIALALGLTGAVPNNPAPYIAGWTPNTLYITWRNSPLDFPHAYNPNGRVYFNSGYTLDMQYVGRTVILPGLIWWDDWYGFPYHGFDCGTYTTSVINLGLDMEGGGYVDLTPHSQRIYCSYLPAVR